MVIEDESFIPTFSLYNKMVKNKYAQKVLLHTTRLPVSAGSLVTFAQTLLPVFGIMTGLTLAVTLVVIETDAAPITSLLAVPDLQALPVARRPL